MNTPDGGPAFPTKKTLHITHDDGAEETGFVEMRGMTVRDYFAAAALQGLLAAPDVTAEDRSEFAVWAYKYADAMLAERAKGGAE